MTAIYKYRILAFVVAHKLRRRNSLLYGFEKKYLVAKELSMSPTTYSKYLAACLQHGYAVRSSDTICFTDLRETIYDLFGAENSMDLKHARFFAGVQHEVIDYKEILRRVEFSFADVNFKRQQYQADKIIRVLSSLQNRFLTHKEGRAAKRLARANGCEITDLPCIYENRGLYIKSGKNHLAKILGCCPTTAANRFKSWAKFSFIQRTKVVESFRDMPLHISAFKCLRSMGHPYPFVLNDCWHSTIGSKIERMSK